MTPGWTPRWASRRDAEPEREARAASGPRVRVLSRVGCHLCAEALAVVARVCEEAGVSYVVDDVDAEATLVARYGTLVPVVFVDGAQVATWRVDPAELRRALA